MSIYAVSIFLSAFLLFLVQPVVAKMIVPWFGGSAAVWTTCLLFFQLILLLGYGYAHWLVKRFDARRSIDATGCLVLPGFVNAHTHSPMTLLRGVRHPRRGASHRRPRPR